MMDQIEHRLNEFHRVVVCLCALGLSGGLAVDDVEEAVREPLGVSVSEGVIVAVPDWVVVPVEVGVAVTVAVGVREGVAVLVGVSVELPVAVTDRVGVGSKARSPSLWFSGLHF